jgi:hypothetical protein
VVKPEGTKRLGTFSYRRYDGIIDLKSVGCKNLDWICPMAGSCQHGNKHPNYTQSWIFGSRLAAVSFSRKTLLREPVNICSLLVFLVDMQRVFCEVLSVGIHMGADPHSFAFPPPYCPLTSPFPLTVGNKLLNIILMRAIFQS